MRVRAFSLLLVAVVVFIALSLQGCSPASNRTQAGDSRRKLRVLFIGNSYTIYNDLPWVTSQLSLSSGMDRPLEVKSVALMGATLKEHWDDGFALKEIRDGGPWDYVVLQGQSLQPIIAPEVLSEYARRFDGEIKAAGAKTILFVTWARHAHPEQQPAINSVYEGVARETGAALAPVGPAWQDALEADPNLMLYRNDADDHPAAAGTYLAACVIYSTIYRRSPEGLTAEISDRGMSRHEFDPVGNALENVKKEPFIIPEAQARMLQRTAWAAVERAGSGG
jgi:hypothetical protein